MCTYFFLLNGCKKSSNILLSEKDILLSVYITTSPLKKCIKINSTILHLPCHHISVTKAQKNAAVLIRMSVSSSTFIRLDGQIWKCTIIWSVSHNFVIWLTYIADEYISLQTQKNYLHTVLQITIVLDITGECFGTGSGETVQSTVPCTNARNTLDNPTQSAHHILSWCVPSPFHTQNSSSSFLACEQCHGPEDLLL